MDGRLFLSTPSARRATNSRFISLINRKISIHALREEGDRKVLLHFLGDPISIHALREEGDFIFSMVQSHV